jgi:hypothetical protein
MQALVPEKQILIEPVFWIQSAQGKSVYGFDLLLSSSSCCFRRCSKFMASWLVRGLIAALTHYS